MHEVQIRNVNALMQVIKENSNKNIVIGSHGTALSTIINYFEPSFGFNDFQRVRTIMPWIVKLIFQGDELVHIEEIDVFGSTKIRKAVGAIIIESSNKVLAVIPVNVRAKTGVKTVNVLLKKKSVPAMSVHSPAGKDYWVR